MRTKSPWRARLSIPPIVVFLSALASFGGADGAPQDPPGGKPKDSAATASFPRHGSYIGTSTCKDCHEEQHGTLLKGHHAGVLADLSSQGCETCHGPGGAHADDEDNATKLITHPRKLDMSKVTALCSRCHADAIRTHGGDVPGFAMAGKTCTSCHNVHASKTPPHHAGLAFTSKGMMYGTGKNKPREVGASKCLECHPRRNHLLGESLHHGLVADKDPASCEACHGPGSYHVESGGVARLITRPDTAKDGVATCRTCHGHVDPHDFHWAGRHKPLLSAGLVCASCHQVHKKRPPKPKARPSSRPSRVDGETGTLIWTDWQDTKHNGKPPTNRVCATCHAPAFKILKGTIHASVGALDTPLDQGCAACHSGALEHARNGGRKHLVRSMRGDNAKTQAQTCNQCHGKEKKLRHHKVGSHFKKDVGCLQCHSPAAPKHLVKEDAEKNCASCHQAVAASFRLPNHHPVDVSRKDLDRLRPMHMGCSDCHDPHGARPKIRNRTLRQDNCVKCHKRYQGPFVFAHQASRSDGCVACHMPHGSSNKRMLKQATTQQNCLQCHGNFPAFHDQTKGAVFTNCLNCHTQVHGSNHSRLLFR